MICNGSTLAKGLVHLCLSFIKIHQSFDANLYSKDALLMDSKLSIAYNVLIIGFNETLIREKPKV